MDKRRVLKIKASQACQAAALPLPPGPAGSAPHRLVRMLRRRAAQRLNYRVPKM